tara:strand:- start:71878 stop:71997 length:120 start_codon:yes stop_codon:yes gene_type:complete
MIHPGEATSSKFERSLFENLNFVTFTCVTNKQINFKKEI